MANKGRNKIDPMDKYYTVQIQVQGRYLINTDEIPKDVLYQEVKKRVSKPQENLNTDLKNFIKP